MGNYDFLKLLCATLVTCLALLSVSSPDTSKNDNDTKVEYQVISGVGESQIELQPPVEMIELPAVPVEQPRVEVNYNCGYWDEQLDSYGGDFAIWAKRVIMCESTCSEGIYNSVNGIARGLFQFQPETWSENCTGDITNGFDQIRCAHSLYSMGQTWRWSCK